MTKILDLYKSNFVKRQVEYLTMDDYLDLCKSDPLAYSSAAERMIAAIGEPRLVDTSKDARLSRIFLNRTVKIYPSFDDFYGMEDTIERIVSYFKHSAQGLEEKKQILYLLGPVGGGKSSIAERLKELVEKQPIYVLTVDDTLSPVFENPLGLFSNDPEAKQLLEEDYGIHKRYLNQVLSPWAIKRLREFDGNINKFRVAKIYPSKLEQIAVCKTEPGDDNNQDISTLVGKTDIRMLEKYSQNDPDAYSFSGALCRGNQGIMEFVEMFKAPIKVLHPLLTATQEGNYVGTESISAIPFSGIVIAHSNEAEWHQFKNNKNNEAFIDRMCIVEIPYCLRVTEEQDIYQKMLDSSDLFNAPTAPRTLTMLAEFSVLSRIIDHENSNPWSKMRVYDGENIKETDPRAKAIQEYRDSAGVNEGMNGISTRFAYKILSKTFNFDSEEISADPVHLMVVLEESIRKEQFPADREKKLINFIKEFLAPKYLEFVGNEIQTAYIESYDAYGQNMFDKYIEYADHYLQDIDWKDPDTGAIWNRDRLNNELEKIEKPFGISNPKDFRSEVFNFVLRQKSKDHFVKWTSYEKLKKVIEKKLFSSTEELLPIISFGAKQDKETEKKHNDFLLRMVKKGYTEKQVRRAVDFYLRSLKSS